MLLETQSFHLAYPDVPEPLGRIVAEYRIAAATAVDLPLLLTPAMLRVKLSLRPENLSSGEANEVKIAKDATLDFNAVCATDFCQRDSFPDVPPLLTE